MSREPVDMSTGYCEPIDDSGGDGIYHVRLTFGRLGDPQSDRPDVWYKISDQHELTADNSRERDRQPTAWIQAVVLVAVCFHETPRPHQGEGRGDRLSVCG